MTTRHNKEVYKEINSLKRKGFSDIKAHVSGYEKPDPIGKQKRIPDIEATKRGKRVIVEVEEKSQVTKQKKTNTDISPSCRTKKGYRVCT